MKNKTSKKAWSGFKPSEDHFMVFERVSHVCIPNYKWIQVNEKSIRSILLRVGEELKAYKLYDSIFLEDFFFFLEDLISKDVVFE